MGRGLLTPSRIGALLGAALAACASADDGRQADAGRVDVDASAFACSESPCGRFGQCVEEQNIARCACAPGYQGPRCTDCAPGTQDRNGDGVCENACSAGSCPPRGNCDDSTGTIVCRCEPGYVLSGNQCVPDGTIPVPSGRTATPELR